MQLSTTVAGVAAAWLATLSAATPIGSLAGTNSSSSTSNSTTTASNSTSTTQIASGPTLLPAVHWDYPVGDIRNLAPKNSSDLYYSYNGVSDPSVEHIFASLSTTLQYEAVVLDHSSHVKDTTCTEEGIVVSFASIDAYRYACDSWAVVEEFVLVTYTEGCHGPSHDASDEQRTFWLTGGKDKLTFREDTQSITCTIEREIAIEDALHGVDMQWGTYYPPTSAGSTSGTGSGTGSSASSGGSSGGNGGSGGSSAASGSGSTSRTGGTQQSMAESGSDCGKPSSATIDGLPDAACGADDFDQDIDKELGYMDFGADDYQSSLKDFIPDVDFSGEDLDDDDVVIERRSNIRKRGLWSALKRAASAVAKVATAPLKVVSTAIQNIPVVGKFIAEKATIEPKVGGTANVNIGPKDNAVSPWGNAALLYSKSGSTQRTTNDVALYCINCGLKGQIVLSGSAKFNLLDGLSGLKELKSGINANIEAGLNLGLYAAATYSDKKTKSLLNQAIPNLGLSVKGVFAAGVFVGIDAVATVNARAQGQALVGVTMLIPNFQATLNLLDADGASKSSITGYTPTWQKRFEASGQIDIDARLALPISINVGIQIIPISYKKSIALIEQPSLYGKVVFAGSAGTAGPASATCNNGLSYFANAQNDILLDFLGLKTFTLNHYDSPPLLEGCKQISGSSKRGIFPRQDNGTYDDNVIANDQQGAIDASASDNSINENLPVDDPIADPNGAGFQSDSEGSQTAATAATDNDGFTYALLQETHGAFELAPDDNGNLYVIGTRTGAGNGGYLFSMFDGAIIGDDQLRSLHYYPGEVTAYGVSRIRLSYEDQIPNGADMIGLKPQEGTDAVQAVTPDGQAFGLVVCNFDNGATSKVFLVKDETGLDKLKEEDLRYTVTGAPVTNCAPMAMAIKPAS